MQADTRFSRLELAMGAPAVERLQKSRVTVIGLGGVGGIAAEILVRSGIGHLRIVDTDTIQPTDINRQVFALESTLNRVKVHAAESRLLDINPGLKITADHIFFHADTADFLLHPKPDFVIDAIDAVLPKVELLAYCSAHSVPVISAMGAAMKTDWKQVRVSDIRDTRICPLARVIRRRLGRRGIRKGITCVYSIEPSFPARTEQVSEISLSIGNRGRPRQILGSYAPVISLFGILAADHVIQSILKISA